MDASLPSTGEWIDRIVGIRAEAVRNLKAAKDAGDLEEARQWKGQLKNCDQLLAHAVLKLLTLSCSIVLSDLWFPVVTICECLAA
jgi:hypothetical protein